MGPALRAVAYEGTPAARAVLRMTLDEALDGAAGADAAAPGLLVVMSYEALRADADWAAGRPWHYCVLDEGHVIRNPRARVAQAAKRVSAQHRLILSGTPIQNDVLELWALFDFLMPGFLGGQAAFRARYGRALTEARGSRAGAAAAQAGLLALDGLHKQVPRPAPPRPASGGLVPAAQGCPGAVPPCACFARWVRPCSAGMVLQPLGPRTAAGRRRRACRWGAPAAAAGQADRARRPQVMPFILRRTKDAVLDDLPPKIVQDVLCDPSPLQLRLYEDFARSAASAEAAGALAAGGGGVAAGAPGGGAPHVFQARLATAGVMRQGCAAQHVSAGIGAGAASARCHMGAAGCSLAVAASPHQHARAAQLLVHRLRPLLMPACAAVAHRRGGAGCEAVRLSRRGRRAHRRCSTCAGCAATRCWCWTGACRSMRRPWPPRPACRLQMMTRPRGRAPRRRCASCATRPSWPRCASCCRRARARGPESRARVPRQGMAESCFSNTLSVLACALHAPMVATLRELHQARARRKTPGW